MSFEAVLGNKEFEFVVSDVTLTVVTWCISARVSERYCGSGTHFQAKTVSLALLTSSTSLLSGSKKIFLIQRTHVTCT
jgi:hypothetical protein